MSATEWFYIKWKLLLGKENWENLKSTQSAPFAAHFKKRNLVDCKYICLLNERPIYSLDMLFLINLASYPHKHQGTFKLLFCLYEMFIFWFPPSRITLKNCVVLQTSKVGEVLLVEPMAKWWLGGLKFTQHPHVLWFPELLWLNLNI